MTLLERPLFHVGHHYVTVLGLIAFAGFFATGLIIARFLQSQIVRRFFSRFKIDTSFIAIVTTILSLAAIVFFTVTAVNAAGIPLAWNRASSGDQAEPGSNFSAGRAADGGVLALLRHEAFSF